MGRKFLAIILILLVTGIFLDAKSGRAAPDRGDEPEKITLGVAARESSGLIYIAEQKGFYKKQGLDVIVREYDTGLFAVQDLLSGKVDVATAAEFVFVTKSFERSALRIFATVARVNDSQCIARRDRGIEKPTDLIGKRIGVVPGMQAEFFSNSFLAQNGIRREAIVEIRLQPAEIIKALGDGKIDAVITGLNTQDIRDLLGKNGVAWSAQGIQDYYFLLMADESFIRAAPGPLTGCSGRSWMRINLSDSIGRRPRGSSRRV